MIILRTQEKTKIFQHKDLLEENRCLRKPRNKYITSL